MFVEVQLAQGNLDGARRPPLGSMPWVGAPGIAVSRRPRTALAEGRIAVVRGRDGGTEHLERRWLHSSGWGCRSKPRARGSTWLERSETATGGRDRGGTDGPRDVRAARGAAGGRRGRGAPRRLAAGPGPVRRTSASSPAVNGGPSPPRRGSHEPRDRRPALHQHEDRREPREQHARQAASADTGEAAAWAIRNLSDDRAAR